MGAVICSLLKSRAMVTTSSVMVARSTAKFSIVPSFVASITKNKYEECTKALRRLVSTYHTVGYAKKNFVLLLACFGKAS